MPTMLITVAPFHLNDVPKIHFKAGLLMIHVQRIHYDSQSQRTAT